MSDLIKKFNTSKNIYLYWIFLYSYDSKQLANELNDTSIYIFPFSYYTLYDNRALWVYYSDRPLDLTTDEDLDLILKKYRLSNVKSMSELNISSNTNIICFGCSKIPSGNPSHCRHKEHGKWNFGWYFWGWCC